MRQRLRNWLIALAATVAAGVPLTRAIINQEAQSAGLDCADAQAITNAICDEDQDLDCIAFAKWVVPEACNITLTPQCSLLANGDLCRRGKVVSGPSWDATGYPACDPALGDPVPCTARDGWGSRVESVPKTFKEQAVRSALRRIKRRLDEDLASKVPDNP